MVGERHIDIGKASLWYLDIHQKLVFFDSPRYADHSICTHRRALAPCQVAHRVRSNLYQVAMTLNAQQVRDEQVLDVCHHKVVHGSSVIRIPLFCQRGLSFLDLVAVAWHIIVVQHLVEQFPMSVLGQRVE